MRRSMMFLPGNSPRMLMNGPVLPADSLIFDLEDAVAPDQKDAARVMLAHALTSLDFGQKEIVVRINDLASPYWQADLDKVMPARPNLIMPPKVARAEDIEKLAAYLDQKEADLGITAGKTGILPLLELALGVENAFAIAQASPRVVALFLGGEDLSANLRSPRTKDGWELFYARTRLVNAARAAEIDVIDTPFTDTDDLEGLRQDAEFAKSLGFSGKSVISPRHLDIVNEVFSPSQAEIIWAQEVMAVIEEGKRLGKGAVSLHGKMVDKPIVMRAEQILENAKAMDYPL
ncbi:MAG: CoA ester lyase [Eubacteriales bacterium]|nr:CoA ester lyase [Clostridiales bacterium]MDY5835953.1 CoA ester lyase [Eubacteriales bacterium]